MSSRRFQRLLESGGASFVRQRGTSHAVYQRIVNGRRYVAPVVAGRKTLDPVYCRSVLKQLQFSDQEIDDLLP